MFATPTTTPSGARLPEPPSTTRWATSRHAATVAATLPGARIERIEGLGELVEVVLGEEFTTVQYPQASGTALSVDVIYTGTSTPTQLPSDLTVTNGADISCE